MQDGLRRSTSLEKVSTSLWKGTIDPSWHQGRGAFGGLAAALLLSAMEEEVADAERTPRSLTISFCAPCVGDFELRTELVRKGSRVAHANARIVSAAGEVMTMATASFCRPRNDSTAYATAVMPRVGPADDHRDFPRGVPGIPRFFDQIDARFCGEQAPRAPHPLPFSGAREARVAAWLRMRPDLLLDVDASIAAMLLDILPPAVAATFSSPRPLASVNFTVDFFAALPLRPSPSRDAFYLASITSRWAGEGYTEELRDLWTADGVLLAQCRQLIALL